MKHEELLAILADIKILDRLFVVTPTGWKAGPDATYGWHLQVTYNEADVDTGKIEQQYSRKWYIADDATESDVVDTAFAAVMRSYDHVVQEHFTYKGKRIFSPHFTVEQRLSMATACPVCQGPHSDMKHRAVRANEDLQRETESVLAIFENWLRHERFEQVDELLRIARIADSAPSTIIAVLSITHPAKDKLKHREAFLARAEKQLREELGDDRANDLLKNRR